MPQTIILSLGGSLIVPDKIDVPFLKNFKETIEKYIKKGHKFVIICGGGRLAREMQEAASSISKPSNEDLDWLGIHSTRLNALLLRYVFSHNAQDMIITKPDARIILKKGVALAAGWLPGCSTDYDAVLIARNLNAKEVINMSNIDYVYDKDPNKNKGSKKIEKISWEGYRKLVSGRWKAGMNTPFDPVAAKEAQKSRMKVFIIGRDLKNLESLLDGRRFEGTTIQ